MRTDPEASTGCSAEDARRPPSIHRGTSGSPPATRPLAPRSLGPLRDARSPRADLRGNGTRGEGGPPGCLRSGRSSLELLACREVYTPLIRLASTDFASRPAGVGAGPGRTCRTTAPGQRPQAPLLLHPGRAPHAPGRLTTMVQALSPARRRCQGPEFRKTAPPPSAGNSARASRTTTVDPARRPVPRLSSSQTSTISQVLPPSDGATCPSSRRSSSRVSAWAHPHPARIPLESLVPSSVALHDASGLRHAATSEVEDWSPPLGLCARSEDAGQPGLGSDNPRRGAERPCRAALLAFGACSSSPRWVVGESVNTAAISLQLRRDHMGVADRGLHASGLEQRHNPRPSGFLAFLSQPSGLMVNCGRLASGPERRRTPRPSGFQAALAQPSSVMVSCGRHARGSTNAGLLLRAVSPPREPRTGGGATG